MRAETESELIEKLARAQSHATKLIRKQAPGLLIESISDYGTIRYHNVADATFSCVDSVARATFTK